MGLLEGEIHEIKKQFAVTRGRKGTETKVSVPTMEREFNKLEKRLKELEKEGKDENDPEVKKIQQQLKEMQQTLHQVFVESENKHNQKQKEKQRKLDEKNQSKTNPAGPTPQDPIVRLKNDKNIGSNAPRPSPSRRREDDEEEDHTSGMSRH